jgi:glycosyltransferase
MRTEMPQARPTISVITAVYNRSETIGESIDSTLSQKSVDLELVIQDGGSNDGTISEVRRRNDPRILLESAYDKGIYDAINRGICRARGDVIGLMHSDDRFSECGILERVANVLKDPDLDGVYGDLDYVSASDGRRVIRRWRSGPYLEKNLRRGWMPPHPTLYLRRSVFERFGLYDTSLQIAADYEAMLRYLVGGKIRLAYIPMVMVQMRTGGESNRSVSRILRKTREDYIAIRRHGIGGLGTLAAKNVSKLGQFLPGKGNLQ